MSSLMFALLATAGYVTSVRSEEDWSTQPEVNSTYEDPHITTSVSFPDQKSQTPVFKLNERVNPVFAMQNTQTGHGSLIHVEYAIGYLYQKGTKLPVQNCTGVRYNRTLSPGETISMQYEFEPTVGLGSFQFVLQAFYLNENRETKMKTALINSVQFVSDRKWSDAFRYVLFVLIFVGGILGIRWMNASEKRETGDDIDTATPRNRAPTKEWEGIPKEHLRYVKSRQGKR